MILTSSLFAKVANKFSLCIFPPTTLKIVAILALTNELTDPVSNNAVSSWGPQFNLQNIRESELSKTELTPMIRPFWSFPVFRKRKIWPRYLVFHSMNRTLPFCSCIQISCALPGRSSSNPFVRCIWCSFHKSTFCFCSHSSPGCLLIWKCLSVL